MPQQGAECRRAQSRERQWGEARRHTVRASCRSFSAAPLLLAVSSCLLPLVHAFIALLVGLALHSCRTRTRYDRLRERSIRRLRVLCSGKWALARLCAGAAPRARHGLAHAAALAGRPWRGEERPSGALQRPSSRYAPRAWHARGTSALEEARRRTPLSSRTHATKPGSSCRQPYHFFLLRTSYVL